MNYFLEIDNNLFNYDNLDIIYNNHNIYLIHFPKCSSGCPIFNILNYKIIGIQKLYNEELVFLSILEFNSGTALKLSIKDFYI